MIQKGVTPATATSAGSSHAGGKVTYKAQRISPAGSGGAAAPRLPTMRKHAATSAATRLLPPMYRRSFPNVPVPECVWGILHPPLSERGVECLCEVSQEVLRVLTPGA